MDGLFAYFAFFAFAFFAVLAIVFVIRLLDVPTFLKRNAGEQRELLEGIHAELKSIRQGLERS